MWPRGSRLQWPTAATAPPAHGSASAACWPGLAMNLSDCGADHALGHALGGRLGLPHGLSVGLVLAETLDIDRAACPDRLERVADALGEPAGGAADGSRAVRAVRRILAGIGFPTCAEAGVRPAGRGRPRRRSPSTTTASPSARTPGPPVDIRRAYAEALAIGTRRTFSNR